MWDVVVLYVDCIVNFVIISYVEIEIDEIIWVYNKFVELVKLVINN